MKPSGTAWQPIVLLAMLMLCLSAISGCDRAPTDPQPKEPTDYIAYFADLNSDNWVFGYHILSGQLDSFQVPALPGNNYNHWQLLKPRLVVSADGSQLYIGLEDSVLKCDIDNPLDVEVVAVPAGDGLAVSSDGNYFAAFGKDGLSIFHTADNSLLFHDTDHVLQGGFTADNERFYATAWGSYAYQVSFLDTSEAERIQLSQWFLGQAVPGYDDGHWFLLTNNERCTAAIEVYDAETNTTLRLDTFGGWGEIELLPNGRYVPISHPSVPWIPCGGSSSSFSVFDTKTNSVTEIDIVLDSADVDLLHDLPYWPMFNVEVTPDSRWIVASGRGVIAVVDATTLEPRDYSIFDGKHIYYLTIQNSL